MSFDVILPFLKPIKHLLEAQSVSEIMVNPDSSIWVEEEGAMQHLSGLSFEEGALFTSLEVIANRLGKKLDADSPIMNVRLPDGSRLAAMIPPLVHPRPLLTIRKFTSRHFKIEDLILCKMLTDEQASILAAAVWRGDNLLISGGTGSGKTTLLNVLASFIPDQERILVIEDTAELQIHKPHVVAAEAQLDTHKNQIQFGDLLKAVLRHRPDRIIVGEIRGAEARVFLDALNTGHRGSLSTIHANGAGDAIRRLAQLAKRTSGNTRLQELVEECYRSIDLVVHVTKTSSYRHVTEIARTAETMTR